MRRRAVVTALASAVAWPALIRAENARSVIGFLHSGSAEGHAPFVAGFREGLADEGFSEGENLLIQYRWADGEYDRLPALAAELVEMRVAAIAALGASPPAHAAQRATNTIPIVFSTGADPVQTGLVQSLSRPGGNMTGVSALSTELGPKRVELLQLALPGLRSAALLVNPKNPIL